MLSHFGSGALDLFPEDNIGLFHRNSAGFELARGLFEVESDHPIDPGQFVEIGRL